MNMKAKWLLEPEIFEGEETPLLDKLSELEVEYKTCLFGKPYEEHIKKFHDDDCVIFHGSLQFGRIIQRKTKWIPGAYCNLPKFECSYYYPRFGKFLLNSDYVMIPFGALADKKNWLFNHLGDSKDAGDSKLLVRPSSGYKIFTGKVVEMKNWEEDLKLFGFYDVEPEALVVVATPSQISSEWRLIVVDKKIVAASQYKAAHNQDLHRAGAPDDVLAFGQEVVNSVDYEPDPAWTLDICLTENMDLKVIEVGSFSCCGLYKCSPEPIIKAIEKVALREWGEYHE
jgi:hypothetical protein